MRDFNTLKQNIERTLLSLPGRSKTAHIELCGTRGSSGFYTCKTFLSEKRIDLLSDDFRATPHYDALWNDVFELKEASASEPFGPFYLAIVDMDRNAVDFTFHWMNDPELTPKTVVRGEGFGWMPAFMFTLRFNAELLQEAGDSEVFGALESVIYKCLENDIPYADELRDAYAVSDLITDVNNGSWDQYFRRHTDTWGTGRFSRLEMYQGVLRMLDRLKMEEAAQRFRDLIAIYANFRDYAEECRKALDIPAVPKPSETDYLPFMEEFFDQMEAGVCRYIRDNIDELSVDFLAAGR